VLGSSQAMKAAWIEDMLSLLPPLAFLIANRFRSRPPSERFPWGFHRTVSIAYLAAAIALLVMGTFVLLDSAFKLVKAEHPGIGLIEILGYQVWLGWVMIAALVYSGIPPVILGRIKTKLAAQLHDKVLYADAEMNRADWLTASAAIIGILGIGLGIWFADAVAAIVISLDIVHDGWKNVRTAGADLMDQRPAVYDDDSKPHPCIEAFEKELRELDWVEDAQVRLREHGHVFVGEAFVVPVDDRDMVERVEEAHDRLNHLDWQLHDITIAPVRSLEQAGSTEGTGTGSRDRTLA
jgi:cation diffusion facilitator family transporter